MKLRYFGASNECRLPEDKTTGEKENSAKSIKKKCATLVKTLTFRIPRRSKDLVEVHARAHTHTPELPERKQRGRRARREEGRAESIAKLPEGPREPKERERHPLDFSLGGTTEEEEGGTLRTRPL